MRVIASVCVFVLLIVFTSIDSTARRQDLTPEESAEVARRADVSHGAPAHYFKNKAGLLSSFAAEGLSPKPSWWRGGRSQDTHTAGPGRFGQQPL